MLFPWYIKYPNQNDEILNLDWILSTIDNLVNEVANFVSLNTIKYADPIQWNITTQYEKNTVVIDPITGSAYISTKPVPSGVGLNNTDYWNVIFTLDVISANKNITLRDDANNILATFESEVDDWLLWQGTLYIVTRAIEIGQSYVVGYNIERYTVERFLKEYITNLRTYVDTAIGDLEDLETSEKNDIVAAINSVLSDITTLIGDLTELETTEKASIVGAINELVELVSDITNNIGTLSDLDTTVKTSLVAAINEVVGYIGDLDDLETVSKTNLVTSINEVVENVGDLADELKDVNVFNTLNDFKISTKNFDANDVVLIKSTLAVFKIVPSSNPLCVNSVNAIGELMPDSNGYYNLNGLELAANSDLYALLNYMIHNGKCNIILPSGTFTLSQTLVMDDDYTPLINLKGGGINETVINCTQGFLKVSIDHFDFRGSSFKDFTISSTNQNVGGSTHNGLELISKRSSVEDLADNLQFENLRIKYFYIGISVTARHIWNEYENVHIQYCTYGYQYNNTTNIGFFNCNSFINCSFDTNGCNGLYIHCAEGHGVSNSFISCSIEGNYYSDAAIGNPCEAELLGISAVFNGCHFEKGAVTISHYVALLVLQGCIVINGGGFIKYTENLYSQLTDGQIVFNQPSLYNSVTTPWGGTAAVINNAFNV